MSKTTNPNEHTSNDHKSQGCCGGTQAKDQKPDATQKLPAQTSAEHVHEDAQKSGGCCGGGKANK
jgi:hypothetical protein